MPRPLASPLLLVLLPATVAASESRSPEVIVETLCAGCHGPLLTGGSGPNLLDDLNHHGNEPEAVRESIVAGRPATGMPPFGALLSVAETDALVAFLAKQRLGWQDGSIRPPRPPDSVSVASERMRFRVETFVGGLGVPWGLAFLSEGRMLVSEREGRLRVVRDGRLLPEPVRGTPATHVFADGGYLDVVAHPDHARNGWIYLAYAEAGAAPGATATTIVRGRIRDGAWCDEEVIFRVPEAHQPTGDHTHYGCRLRFDRGGHLYFTIGDRGRTMAAQDLASPLGKIHRVHDDGRPPADNPFVGRPDAWPTIWSLGHRNPQGLDFDPVNGALWATEHGPRGGDELNLVIPGRNYGWPLVSHGHPQFGEAIGGTHREGLEPSAHHWPLSIAPSGIAFSTSDRYPGWKNHLLVATLVGEHLRRLELDDAGRVTHEELLFHRLGRVRHVAPGPDGFLYVILNRPGRIARLVPEE